MKLPHCSRNDVSSGVTSARVLFPSRSCCCQNPQLVRQVSLEYIGIFLYFSLVTLHNLPSLYQYSKIGACMLNLHLSPILILTHKQRRYLPPHVGFPSQGVQSKINLLKDNCKQGLIKASFLAGTNRLGRQSQGERNSSQSSQQKKKENQHYHQSTHMKREGTSYSFLVNIHCLLAICSTLPLTSQSSFQII